MRRLHDLPDDILIPIFSNSDINTFFSLRLTCTSFCAALDTYVRTIAPAVANNTFPGCRVLLTPPVTGYSLRWLRGLIPAYLASVVLDKDKLRRYPYINSGFPYGMPSESDCEEAKHWRERVANGWRVLRSLYMISDSAYAGSQDDLRRPNAMRRVSSGMRSSRLWQAMSCPYPGCTEHGMKHIFDGRDRRSSDTSQGHRKESAIESISRRESIVLKRRLALLEKLPDHDLLSYVYLWRLLQWTFRPYRMPKTKAGVSQQQWSPHHEPQERNWSSIISDITQGCSWLNWFVLSVGSSLFFEQWSLNTAPNPPGSFTLQPNVAQSDLVRNTIWEAYDMRTPHQIEVEREYICKFEFALRKRCLSPLRLKSLEAEIYRGRQIRTISLDCIPWVYDQHPMIARPPSDFPWYESGQWIWLDGQLCLQTRPGTTWSQPGMLKLSLGTCRTRGWEIGSGYSELLSGEDVDGDGLADIVKGSLEQVPYLVYLGVEEAGKVWARSEADVAEFVF
ncbi:hypothetical protein BKA66DRAFT_567506 [Pyrenochaeta sp. MPI-SDFR-AT-0127]|nr:hypothetical protein BKA66DRAFT_567506 [Pyrenochaeta sp. MPI-SDFR-AT-0127]